MSLVNDQDCKRIEETIARIEKRSAVEFVVAVIPRSGEYPRGRTLLAGAWAVAAAVAYFRLVPWGGEAVGLLLELPVFFLVWSILGVPALHRRLIPSREAETTVHGMAFRMFAEHGVHCTRDRTGILLLVSELERRAVLLGDSGIHERVGEDGWPRHIDHLLGRIREGRTADGIIEVLEALETALVGKVPVLPDDVNELSDRVIREP